MIVRGEVGRRPFPPRVVAEVKARACELPAKLGLPLSRFSRYGAAPSCAGGKDCRRRQRDLPTHAGWLNQIETYFSILQRKALTPAHFTSQDQVARRILGFQDHYQEIASPFTWTFTRRNLRRLKARSPRSRPAALPHAA